MFSYFGKQNNNLAFRSDSHEFARAAVVRFAESTLNAWLDGRERDYAARDVIREIRAIFGAGGEQAARHIEQALDLSPDDPGRLSRVTEAVQLVARQLRGNPADMA